MIGDSLDKSSYLKEDYYIELAFENLKENTFKGVLLLGISGIIALLEDININSYVKLSKRQVKKIDELNAEEYVEGEKSKDFGHELEDVE